MLLLKSVMRREWEPNKVGAEVCPEAIDAESRGGEQWTVRVLRNCAYVCVSPEGVRERTPCDVKRAVRACTLFLGLDPANSRNCCIAGIAPCDSIHTLYDGRSA